MISPILTAVFTVAYLLITLWLCRGLRLNARSLALGGITCAITLVLASILIYLPTGSSFSPGSMIPIMVLALIYDYRLAFVTGWISGILVMFLVPGWQPVHWAQIFVEQLVCFSCLGYAGIFGCDKRWKVLAGAVLAVLLKLTGHVLSGVIFFSDNAWDGWGAWGYSLAYNTSSVLPEGLISALVLAALPMHSLAKAVKAGEKV